MITFENNTFKLDTRNTSYVFRVTPFGHLEHIYYGAKLPAADAEALCLKHTIPFGSSVAYSKADNGYCMDTMLLEYSGIGKGDYRQTPIECVMPDGTFVSDFVYDHHRIMKIPYSSNSGLPTAHGQGETLAIFLKDKKCSKLGLVLRYTVFAECDTIVRCAELCNHTKSPLQIRKLMSFMIDLPESGYQIGTLDGGWAKEAHIHERPASYGTFVVDSATGASSNRHNPAFYLRSDHADEEQGRFYGFNLIYSGNHYSAIERSGFDTLRVMSGINPHCFLWRLNPGESFVTPQAVLTCTDGGINGLMANMHDFVNRHIIRPQFQNSPRPIVLNNWEATMFDFTKGKLLSMAKRAKELGAEMFVLDDGWFGKRNSDTAGLGDWQVNTKKLPGGIEALCKEINGIGLQFGLWFEPECVNQDSDLFRAHPDWAIQVPGRQPSLGRNQMVLDLTRKEVRDYIVDSVSAVLSCANIEYVKWDYNRHISDMYGPALACQGEFFHRYILGLYEVLRRIFIEKHPNILLENCSSGGNRFDLGMLCFGPQIWTSDDTDAAERLDIQRGVYCFYPPSAVSNHVSMTPNQQTLRDLPLSTRFNVAAFGVLGYELDFNELTPDERKQIKEQIAFYKEHRALCQYGRLRRYFPAEGRESWQISDGETTLAAVYNLSYHACPSRDSLRILGAQPGKRYKLESVKQSLRIGRFGGLIKHVSPVKVKADGVVLRTVDRHFAMTDGQECYQVSGEALHAGIPLALQYSGTGYTPELRILGDWGSSLYLITEE